MRPWRFLAPRADMRALLLTAFCLTSSCLPSLATAFPVGHWSFGTPLHSRPGGGYLQLRGGSDVVLSTTEGPSAPQSAESCARWPACGLREVLRQVVCGGGCVSLCPDFVLKQVCRSVLSNSLSLSCTVWLTLSPSLLHSLSFG